MRGMGRLVLGATLLACTMRLAHGEAARSDTFVACIEQTHGVHPAMMDCSGAEFEYQDQRLNAVYQRLLAQVPATRAKQLRNTQRLWLQYTNANCDFHGNPDGGMAARLAAVECGVSARAERAAELEGLLSVEPGEGADVP